MNYEMSERDSDWHGPMSDPNTGGTLEQIQKERREVFRNHFISNIYGILKNGKIEHPEYLPLTIENVENFLDETIRIAYEAGQTSQEVKDMETYRKVCNLIREEGYQAGLERAKALVPNNYVALSLLADIDAEIKKDTPSQLSERDADWCGLPDENARATSDL